MKSKKIELPIIRAPRGYHFNIINPNIDYGYIVVQLLDKKNHLVGHIDLHPIYPYKTKRLATHSWLNPALRGKGIGTILYSKAVQWGIKHGYRVRSSGGTSTDAQRVWNGKGIRRYFNIRRVERTGYFSDTWYAYAKVSKNKIKGDKHGPKRRV